MGGCGFRLSIYFCADAVFNDLCSSCTSPATDPQLTLLGLSLQSHIRVAVRPSSDVSLACSALESLGTGPEFASHILHQGALDLERLGVDVKARQRLSDREKQTP